MWAATGDSAGRGRWPANSVGNRSGVGWDRCAGRGSGRERGAGTKRAKNPCPSVSNREMIDSGCRPVVDGGAEGGRGKSKRVFRSRRLQLGWLGSSPASHKDGMRVQRRRGLERRGSWSFRVCWGKGEEPRAGWCGRGRAGSWSLRCCEGGVLRVGGSDGGQQGGWVLSSSFLEVGREGCAPR